MEQPNVRVLDTDVVSYLWAGKAAAEPFKDVLTGHIGAISFVTIGELMKGALSSGWGDDRIGKMKQHIRDTYLVLPYTIDVAEEWGALVAACSSNGKTPGANDAWIAATAVAFGCPVVTNDGGFRTMAEHYPKLVVLP